jgi:hypothetical protein
MNKTMWGFITAIVVTGVIRFILDQSGVSHDIVKYFSMTVVVLIGSLYFAIAAKTHKERLKDAYLLVMPYMTVEVLALGYTWITGNPSIFHTAEYSLGYPLGEHLVGHVIGGLTWEPLFCFLVMEIVWGISTGARYLLGRRQPGSVA